MFAPFPLSLLYSLVRIEFRLRYREIEAVSGPNGCNIRAKRLHGDFPAPAHQVEEAVRFEPEFAPAFEPYGSQHLLLGSSRRRRQSGTAAHEIERIAGILAEKLLLAAADTGAKQVCLAGGVAANGRLRQLVNDGAQKLGAKVYLPELKFCGDNGAMIAAQGYYQYIAGHTAGLELNGLPTLPIDYE